MPDKLPPSAERMLRQVGVKQERMARARWRRRTDNPLSAVAILGVVGWSVTIPILLGIVGGIWIDKHWPTRFSWTLILLLAGLVIGCASAWIQIEKEQK